MFNPFRRPPDSVGALPLAVPKTQIRQNQIPEKKASRPLLAAQLATTSHHPAADYASLCREGFARNPIVHRCVRLIAESAASVPLSVSDPTAARLMARCAVRTSVQMIRRWRPIR